MCVLYYSRAHYATYAPLGTRRGREKTELSVGAMLNFAVRFRRSQFFTVKISIKIKLTCWKQQGSHRLRQCRSPKVRTSNRAFDAPDAYPPEAHRSPDHNLAGSSHHSTRTTVAYKNDFKTEFSRSLLTER